MRLEKASVKAIKYACINFHYSKSVPVNCFGWSVFNDKNEWCGVILYGLGANNNLAHSIGLPQGGGYRVDKGALNGKQESTGVAVSISLRLLKKAAPLCKCVISFADPEQGHRGVLYQATNWIYLGESKAQREVFHPITGKAIHKRTANKFFGTIKGLKKTDMFWKHKYVYPLEKALLPILKSISKPYPKKQLHAVEALPAVRLASSQEETFDSIQPLKNKS